MKVLSFIVFAFLVGGSFGQSIWTNPITGTNPNTDNPYTTGQTVDPNITVSGISRGTGATGANANNRYNASGWDTGGLDPTAYFEWTLTPNIGCEIDFTSFVYTGQASGTGPTSFSFRSSVDVFASNIGAPNATGTTITLTAGAYQNITGPITFRFYAWGASAAGGTFSINDFTFNGSTSCGGAGTTITTGAITGAPFSVNCSIPDIGSIDFTSTGTFNSGNTFTVQLSNESGSFANPVNLVSSISADGVDPSGTIIFTIPASIPSGSGYRLRIIASNPTVTSADNGTDISISLTESCTPPHITSVIINSCNSACTEGDNELFFGNTGDYTVDFTSNNIDVFYGTGPSPTTNFTETVFDNPSATIDFNSNAGCPGLFLDAYNTTIPANSSFMIAHIDVCPLDVIDFSNLCGNGPIYVIYVDASAWDAAGNFANSPTCGSGGFRYFQSSITTTLNTNHIVDFYYECALNTGLDGDYAVWDENGGAAQLQGNNGCAFPPVVLPSEIIHFQVLLNGKQTAIFWKTASEQNNDYFTISHSSDGKNFIPLGTVKGAGNSNELVNYQFTHERPSRGINYYKLTSTDYDGTTYNKGIASVLVDADGTYFDPFTAQLKFSEKSDYAVYSTDGKKLGEVWNQESMDFQQNGFIIVQNLRKGTIERLFIP
jgi:hypothetical protein